MRVTVHVNSGAARGQRIYLRSGQVAQFGRTNWADYSFPDDPDMADVHFAIESATSGVRLRQVGPVDTMLNGKQVTEAGIHSGDQISAGRTLFAVEIEGDPGRMVQTGPDQQALAATAEETGAPAGAQPDSAPEVAAYLELDEESQTLAEAGQTPEQLLQRLTETEHFGAALKVQCFLMSKQQAVQWACRCVSEVLGAEVSEKDSAALQAARQWIDQPTEENRRAAQKAAEATEFQTAAGWVALGAFWSSGSLAPPGMAEVPPDDRLTGKAVSAALLMAAALGSPPSLEQRYRTFLLQGREMASKTK